MRRALDDEQERLRRLIRRVIEMEQDPTPEEKAVYQQLKGEIVARIRGLEEQVADTSGRTAALPDLRDLHERLTHTQLADAIRELSAQGDDDGLRDLLLSLVASARVTARWPERRSTWVRVEVTWTPDVQMLLDAGLMSLDAPPPAPPPPEIPASLSAKGARNRRYYWCKHHPGALLSGV